MNPVAGCRALRALFGPKFRTREEIRRYQSVCLRSLLDHAYTRVPYYRNLLDRAGVVPQDIRSVDDLIAIPSSERSDLQKLPAAEICANGWSYQTSCQSRTSGSSGSPLTIRRTRAEEDLMLAFRAQAVGMWGFGARARRANIDHFGAQTVESELQQRPYEALGIMPRLNLDWQTPKNEMIAAIASFKPDLVSGPPSILADLAHQLDDTDRSRIGARQVLTGAELMTAADRGVIEHGFGLPVADVYGCAELVFIAMEAPGVDGYRVCEESVIVEMLDNGEPAQKGEIYLTGLHQWAMPFIRYRLGDCVEVQESDDPHLVLRSIDGRVTDCFWLPDGRRLHGYSLGEIIEDCDLPVRRFQITQHERDVFHIRLVLDGPAEQNLEALRHRFNTLLGPGVTASIEIVDTLGRPLRKFYPFVSFERLRGLNDRRSPF